jgi:hypothetical protein
MKGNLTLLAGAVLLALGTPPARAERVPELSTSLAGTQSRGHFRRPTGSTVLYDQSGIAVSTIVDQNFDNPEFDFFDAALADDFVVSDPGGWAVTSIAVQYDTSASSDPGAATVSVLVFPDDGGRPGETAVCIYPALTPTWDAEFTTALIPLGIECDLTQGTYWLSAVINLDFGSGGQIFADLGDTGTQFDSIPVWEDPAGGWGGICTDWTPIDTCADLVPPHTPSSAMLFQIIGHPLTNPGIDLRVSLAEDNGDPNQCGSATTLVAEVGDRINFCYKMTNNSNTTLDYQSLSDDSLGAIFVDKLQRVTPGASVQYNRIITARASETPTSTWTASDVLPGYTSSAGSQAFVDIIATGTALDLGDDTSANVTMPFSFNLYGLTSNQLCINNNGLMLFATSEPCSGHFNNESVPSPSAFTSPAIMPFWDDLYTGGNEFVQAIGTAPTRQFVVEYFNKDTFESLGLDGYTFEALFNEADNTLDFVYQTITGVTSRHDAGVSATVGLQFDTTLANQYSYNQPSLSGGQSIHWTASMPNVYSASRQVTLDVGLPRLALGETSLSAATVSGSTVSATLDIGNDGTRDLAWNLTEALPASKLPAVAPFIVPFHTPDQTHVGLATRSTRQADSKPNASIAFGSQGVSAYGETFLLSDEYVNFDASAPDTLNTIATLHNAFLAGTFAGNDFSVEYGVDSTGELYAISTADGSLRDIGPTGLTYASGIRWDATGNATYAMNYDIATTTSTLYRLDLTSGATAPIGATDGMAIIDIAVDPSGVMYGVDIVNDTLVAIDKASGIAQVVGSLGFNANYAQGMDFDGSTGILYLAGFDDDTLTGNMYTIDTTSGAATLISPIGPNTAETDAFAIAVPSGPCASSDNVPWLSESPLSGTTAPGSSDAVTVTLDAANLAVGTFHGTVCVNTNDPGQGQVAVPVTLVVTSNGVIFQDGFDGTP